MAATWPNVVQYLLDTLPTLPEFGGVAVFDGPPNTGDDPSDYVTVGYVSDDVAGGFSQTRDSDYLLTEDGTVRLDLTSQSGDDVLTGVRARVFALFDAVDAHLRADQTLGGRLMVGSVTLTADGVTSSLNSRGVAQTVACAVAYHCETPTP